MACFKYYNPGQSILNILVDKLWNSYVAVVGDNESDFLYRITSSRRHLVVVPSLRAARQLRFMLLEKAVGEGLTGLVLPDTENLKGLADRLPLVPVLRSIDVVDRIASLASMLRDADAGELVGVLGRSSSAIRTGSFLLHAFDDLIRYVDNIDNLLERISTDVSWAETLDPVTKQRAGDVASASLSLLVRYMSVLAKRGLADPVDLEEKTYTLAAASPDLGGFCSRFESVTVAGFRDATPGELKLLRAMALLPNVDFLLPRLPDGLLRGIGKPSRSAAREGLERHPFYAASQLAMDIGAMCEVCETDGLGSGLMGHLMASFPGQDGLTVLRARRVVEAADGAMGRRTILEYEDPFHEAMEIAAFAAGLVSSGEGMVVVTPDREGAGLLESVLGCFGLEAESTWGEPLSSCRMWTLAGLIQEGLALGFPYKTVASLLRHPLFRMGRVQDGMWPAWQLEREVVPDAGVSSGLGRLAQAARERQVRLTASAKVMGLDFKPQYEVVAGLLDELDRLMEPLVRLVAEGGTLGGFARAFQAVLRQILSGLSMDDLDEGDMEVLRTLGSLGASAEAETLSVQYHEFAEIAGNLVAGESYQKPRNREVKIIISDMNQSRFIARDWLWLSGLVEGRFPMMGESNPVLPDDARVWLGLRSAGYREGLAAAGFADAWLRDGAKVRFSYYRQDEGVPTIRSRFLERVAGVLAVAGCAESELVKSEPYRNLMPIEGFRRDRLNLVRAPRPVLSLNRDRWVLSATDLKAYLECPYKYLCKRIYDIEPVEEIEEVLSANDTGELVHRAMQAFFDTDRAGLSGLDGPFDGPLVVGRRGEAEGLLRRIMEGAFSHWPSRDLLAGDVLARVCDLVPMIVETEMGRQADGWRPLAFERRVTWDVLNDGRVIFTSRVDRIDRRAVADGSGPELAIIDYKTGMVPGPKEVASGRWPQLFVGGFGARATWPGHVTSSLVYYRIWTSSAKCPTIPVKCINIASNSNGGLVEGYRAMLTRVALDLVESDLVEFPAIPDERVCQLCDYEGICRRGEL